MTRLLTVGHSSRPLTEFVEVLRGHGVRTLADVRSYPRSKRHPQFDQGALAASLPRAGIAYVWLGEELGGMRKFSRRGSPHRALRVDGMRPYADHMESPSFAAAVDALFALGEGTCVMCAERLPKHCHRALLADHLSGVRGAEVLHVVDETAPVRHQLSGQARVDEALGRVVYDVGVEPGEQLPLFG